MTIAIIADDLTGANDSGLQFASYGLPTTVFLGEPSETLLKAAEVAVVDTETRGLEAVQVPALISTVTRRICEIGARHIYKKIDSTMRGHVGIELDAVAQALDARFILMTPAFPAMKRTVEQGILLVDGTPVDRTAIGLDPGSPVHDADLIRLLAPHMPQVQCLSVAAADLADPDALDARLRQAAAETGRACAVFDARTDDELARIARFGTAGCAVDGQACLWAGSAGLAAHLPAAWKMSAARAKAPELVAADRPPLLVLGSVNPVSIAQLELAIGRLGAEPVVLSAERLLGGGESRAAEIARGTAALHERIRDGDRALVLTTAHERADVERIEALAARRAITRGEAGRRIAEGLAAVTRSVLDEDIVDRLVRPAATPVARSWTARELTR